MKISTRSYEEKLVTEETLKPVSLLNAVVHDLGTPTYRMPKDETIPYFVAQLIEILVRRKVLSTEDVTLLLSRTCVVTEA